MGKKTGVLFVGLCGHLSTTAMAGAIAVSKGLCPGTGMISETKPLAKIKFVKLSDFVFGGWDIRSCSESKHALKDIGLENIDDIWEIGQKIEKIQSKTFPGIILNAGDAISEISERGHIFKADSIKISIQKVVEDINTFKSENNLDKVVVINLASTEPPVSDTGCLSSIESISRIIQDNQVENIRPSFIYAYAAITLGCAYINFTPSEAGFSNGLVDLALEYNVPVMGSDGKTGETLVKSALAPMFAMRNLEVLSWEGYNILGNMDGKVLQNEENGSTKIKSKDRLLPHILGYRPHSRVSIDYVPSLGDRKTAWDFIHFQGFLNTKMSLQFTWQGCDSALAAPLVLDLARFGILALEKGESGVMTHMASFFKSPWGVDEHALEKQFRLLEAYCAEM
ncbi:MAG: myo-inositol-1-phosphate synthase [Deltaproteobacteria bacterium]|nr:myo-inositol-1-phosphate synthase [Deltaproteobacteria bacterium]